MAACSDYAIWISSILALLASSVSCDTPANCTYDDILGSWTIAETERTGNSKINCDNLGPIVRTFKVQLLFPNIAIDDYGNKGYWTLIYNQGFEINVNSRKYFAFSYYEQTQDEVTSYCDRTSNGWSHDVTIRNWACISAKKKRPIQPKVTRRLLTVELGRHHNNHDYIAALNNAQDHWTAIAYPQFEGIWKSDLIKLKGGRRSVIYQYPTTAPSTPEMRERVRRFPDEFDWRNISGVNYVSPVRNQGHCGSCYSFASAAMLEARLRILTKNDLQVTLSTQDVVSCSRYSQGCEGGFNYLVGGKYGQDYGFVPEQCNPYVGEDGPCTTARCKRYYVSKYSYVGGFYGACNEELMIEALVKNGPYAVSFMVYDDFMNYKGGVYHKTELSSSRNGYSNFDPFELTDHAVLLVGYGVDRDTGVKYWTIKNSWSDQWGESGYFRIRRGTNECAIESIGVEAFPIPF